MRCSLVDTGSIMLAMRIRAPFLRCSPIKATAPQRDSTHGANTMGTTARAQASIVVFRAAFTENPRPMSADESQPPPTLPTSAIR